MNEEPTNMTAEATAAQQLSDFTGAGWIKAIAPAKVNLYLAIGPKRDDGYHEVTTVMHALNLHDIVYMRRIPLDCASNDATCAPASDEPLSIKIVMLAHGDIETPAVPTSKNTVYRALQALARLTGQTEHGTLEVRIEKSIPAQAGLGGGSSDAAAALLAAAHLWGIDANDPVLVDAADRVGSDIAFFLHGGCSLLEGRGSTFVRKLDPSKDSIVLVRPNAGISTAEAYRTFDASPVFADEKSADAVQTAGSANEIALFNNLAPAAEQLLPELAVIKAWLVEQPGVSGALLCGSGSATFAICDSFATASALAAQARKRKWWARASSFSSIGAALALR